jgi:copper(I)-binding protein
VRLRGLLVMSLLLAVLPARGAGLDAGEVWARASIPGTGTAAVYGSFTNHGDEPVTIRSVSAGVAASAMLHESVMEGDMMKMKHLPSLTIPPGATVRLEPGGMHIMLMGLKRQLRQGDRFPMTLVLDDGSTVELTVKTGDIGQMSAP